MSKIVIKNYNINTNKSINKRICLISDIHHDDSSTIKIYERLINKIKVADPDIIVIAGDIVDYGKVLENIKSREILENFIKELGKITDTLVTVGNHDLQYSYDRFDAKLEHLNWFKGLNKYNGVHYIYNESFNFGKIDFIHYTPSGKWFRSRNKDAFYHEFERYPIEIKKNDNYKILISHSPVSIAKKYNYKKLNVFTENINLILSGHMHNGGVPDFLEFLDFKKTGRGLISPSKKAFPLYCRGFQKIDKMDIIISRGIREFSAHRFLKLFNFLFCSEVTIIDLE